MAKQVIRLSESRLRQLVESCVRETMEDMVEEGYGWDSLMAINKETKASEDWPSREELGDFIKGSPDKARFQKSKDLYNAAKNGEIYSDGGKHSTDPEDYMEEPLMTEPGFSGYARRAGVAAGAVGNLAYKKAKAGIKRGLNRIKPKKNNGSFEL